MPSHDALDAQLEELGVPATPETRRLLGLLATDSHALYLTVRHLAELRTYDYQSLPDVDRLTTEYMRSEFANCPYPHLLSKRKPLSPQCKRLLACLSDNLGEPVSLPELLLVNGLHSATPRRLRELQTEHGSFEIRSFSEGRVSWYVLESPEPDIVSCAEYWLRSNLRDATDLNHRQRVLAYLQARLGTWVARSDLHYILPAAESPGKGRARLPSGSLAAILEQLREDGFAIEVGDETVRLAKSASVA